MTSLARPFWIWVDRPMMADALWTRGVPVEAMDELANRTGVDPWFNLPVNASDDYVRGFATYVRSRLDRSRIACRLLCSRLAMGGSAQ